MFLAKLIVHLFLILETSQMIGHFVLTTKTTQPPPQVFSVNGSIVWQFAALLTFFFFPHIAKFFHLWLTIAGFDELCVEF